MKSKSGFTIGLVGCLLTFLVIFTFSGCLQKEVKKDPFFEKWQARAENARGNSPARRPRLKKSVESSESESQGKQAGGTPQQVTVQSEYLLPTNKISLKMHDIELAVLLRAMAKAARQNIMINEKVQGRANINITEAPWDQVFLGILRTHGLTYAWEGSIIRIMTLEDMEQDLKRAAQKKDFKMIAPLKTQVIEIKYSEAKKLKENLEKFLAKNNEGKPLGAVMVDEHTNSLIIQAIQEDMDEIKDLIDELDRPTPQILIEAHIVEANKNTAMELGVQWGGLSDNGFWITPGLSDAELGTKLSAGGMDPTPGWAANFPANTAGAAGAVGMKIGFAAEAIGSRVLAAQLSALQKDGKLNILSSPSITTLDNQKAIIESGEDIPFQSVEDGEVKIEFKKAVLSLEVTPHVIDGETLKMKIRTKKDEVNEIRQVAGNPGIITKMAETNVLLFDGQTTVIGGLNKEKTQKSESGVPALKDIPLLGWLFKSTDDSGQMEDLLIFITPRILKERVYPAEMNPPASPPPPAKNAARPDATPQ